MQKKKCVIIRANDNVVLFFSVHATLYYAFVRLLIIWVSGGDVTPGCTKIINNNNHNVCTTPQTNKEMQKEGVHLPKINKPK